MTRGNFNPDEIAGDIAVLKVEIAGIKEALYATNAIGLALNDIDRRLNNIEKYLPAIEKQYAGSVAPEGSLTEVLAHVCTRHDNGPCVVCGAPLNSGTLTTNTEMPGINHV